MDCVTIDEVEYVKASVLAKKHNYTTDYIGQLCRARKVDAHLVGRTWYVFPPSLDGHKTTRYSELRSAENKLENSSIATVSRRDVISAVSKNTIKSHSPHFQDRVFWKNPKYQDDTSDLLPNIKKDVPQAQKMKIELAESERVRVVGTSKNVTMITQPMPAVVLAGTLKVLDYAPAFDEVDSAVGDDFKLEKPSHIVHNSEGEREGKEKSVVQELTASSGRTAHVTEANDADERKITYPVAIKKQHGAPTVSSPKKPALTGASKRLAGELNVQKPLEKSPAPEDVASSLFFRLVIAPAVILLTVAVASAMLVLESVTSIEVSGEEVASWRFNSAAVSNFFGPK